VLYIAEEVVVMPRGKNPRSAENLNREGRPPDYPEPKEDHKVTVTQTGWSGVRKLAKSLDMSVSSFLEKLGRGQLIFVSEEELEIIQKFLNDIKLRQAKAQVDCEPSEQDKNNSL
jgi:hypothetical protein